MENNKLQELTQKLYNDGLEKGRSEAERLVAEAKEQAAKILADAQAEADAIAKAAQDRAEDIAKNAMTEITLAGRQALSKIKTEIAEAIILKSTGEAVKAASIDATFIKDMLLSVASNWNASAAEVSLKALLLQPTGTPHLLRYHSRRCFQRLSVQSSMQLCRRVLLSFSRLA